MIRKEYNCSCCIVADSDPYECSSAVPLSTVVLGNIFRTLRQQLPLGLMPRSRHRMHTTESSILVAHTGVSYNAIDLITFLETHKVKWPVMLNESASTLPHASTNAKEVPPKQIVSQHFDVHRRPSITLR